ncbi:DMT family transporter [candidate division KSB1 bacterium]|nr:MAG: DMT family transporter [candidate division KSB1 bacterium]
MTPPFPHFGETLALTTAVVWGLSVILFKKSGETVHPIALNFFKNLLAAGLIIPTMWIAGGTLMYDAPVRDYMLLLLSGVLGIGLSDTFFFMSLNLLGASLSAIVDCLYAPFVIGLSLIFLGESLSLLQIIGVLMIISAVLGVTNPRWAGGISRRNLLLGISWGVLSMVLIAFGVVIAKSVIERSPLLWTTEWRLFGGIGTLIIILLFHRDRRAIMKTLITTKHFGYTVSSSWLGAYLSTVLWLGGMKFTQASTAAALNQTSNIFVFIFAWLVLREPINRVRTIGIIIAVAGVYLVMFG